MNLPRFIIAIPLITLCSYVHAQDTVRKRTFVTTAVRRGIPLDTNEVINDENGNSLKYYQSQKLLNTGNYVITFDGAPGQPGTKKHLKKATPAQQAAALNRMQATMAIPGEYLKVGQPLDVAPLLKLGNLNNLEIDNKVIVLIFWNSGCPPCTESFDSLNDFFTQVHNPQKIAILAITTDEKNIAVAKLKEKPLAYARLISNARNITTAYTLNSYPAFVVTDKNHIIQFATKGMGTATVTAFKNAIRTALAN